MRAAMGGKWGVVLATVVTVLALVVTGPEALLAQAEALGQQQLGRPYWFVFAAYAVCWALILGWIISIARRLGRVEARLQKSAD